MYIEPGALSHDITVAIVLIFALVVTLHVPNLCAGIPRIPNKTPVNFTQSTNSF